MKVHKLKVAMLVANPCINDSRVIRSAEALADAGAEVRVLCTEATGAPEVETINSVEYRRIRFQAKRQSKCALVFLLLVFLACVLVVVHAFLDWVAALIVLALSCLLLLTAKNYVLLPIKMLLSFFKRAVSGYAMFRLVLKYFKFYSVELQRFSPDVIHAHDLATLLPAVRYVSKHGGKCIYDSHELELHRNTKRSWLGDVVTGWIERYGIRRVDAVVTVCDSIADHLAKHYQIKRPVVVMNSPDFTAVSSSDTSIRVQLGLPPETPLIVYVGRITFGRGLDLMVKALPLIEGAHFALVGPVHQPTVDRVLSLARDSEIQERVHIVPPVASREVVSFIRDADVSLVAIQNVCLSYYYCLPNKMLESALAGLPVVASKFPELQQFIELSRAGELMDESSPEDIARAIMRVLSDQASYRMGERERLLVIEKYGWSKQRASLIGLYESI